ncbi:MAG: hypothetical protein WB762_24185 [Candidatus Sulfotelmatobacter sp.]
MAEIKIADSVLRALADQYEHGNVRWLKIVPDSIEEYEDVKERYAELVAKGLLKSDGFVYQFTDAGYVQYSPLIRALRALSPVLV